MTDELRATLQSALGGAYAIERELGGGGMSRVFVATETALQRRVVIKMLPPELAAGLNTERFRREIQLAAQLQHPHIVPLLAAGEAAGLPYYTMPLVEGESLRARLAAHGALPLDEAMRILHEVTDALAYAHAHGVVHRDIKPENILLSGRHAAVADFGVAKALGQSVVGGGLTSVGMAIGTPEFMAPEQAAGDPNVDARADLYALGVVAYEMLTGRTPFAGRTPQAMLAAHATEKPVPVTVVRDTVPLALATLIAQLLEKHPADRPQSAAVVLDELEAMGSSATLTSGPRAATSKVAAIAPRTPRGKKWIAVGATVALVAAAGALLLTRRSAKLDRRVVAVVPFRVSSADPSLRYLREGMLDLLAAKLAGTDSLRTSDPRSVLSAWRRAGGSETADLPQADALKVARELGAGQLLEGDLVGTPTHLVLSASLYDAPTGSRLAQTSVEGPPDSVLTLVDKLAARMLSLSAGEDERRLASLTSTSFPALREYLSGQAFFRRGDYRSAASAFERAYLADTNFALAALQMSSVIAWMGNTGVHVNAHAAAWRLRDKLSARDRALLESIIGTSYPAPASQIELFHAAERYTNLAPDSPEAWFNLGDDLFHFGSVMEVPDAPARALAAMARAVALDSTFVQALEHLPQMYYAAGDTASLRRIAVQMAKVQDSTADLAAFNDWFSALSLGDSARAQAAREALSKPGVARSALGGMAGSSLEVFAPRGVNVIAQVEEAGHKFLTHAQSDGDRANAVAGLLNLALAQGQPAKAAQLVASAPITERNRCVNRAISALFAEGDSAAGEQGARDCARIAAGVPKAGELPADLIWPNMAAAEMSLAHGDVAGARMALGRLQSLAVPDTAPASWPRLLFRRSLEAQLAAREKRADAPVLLARLDSTLRYTPYARPADEIGNLVAAQLWEQTGNAPRALVALRRRPMGWTMWRSTATTVREEARLAAATGDREGAIRGYKYYLTLQQNAEPSRQAHLAEVRKELARLEKASTSQ